MFFKILIVLFIILCFLSGVAHAGENFDISGDVIFNEDGDIYICLLSKEEWRDFQSQGYELSAPQCKHVKMTSDLKKEGKLSFSFEGVPNGTYSIVAYQDVNGNGKVDFKGFHIGEPWESYREKDPITSSSWDTVKFDLDKDTKEIKIKM